MCDLTPEEDEYLDNLGKIMNVYMKRIESENSPQEKNKLMKEFQEGWSRGFDLPLAKKAMAEKETKEKEAK